MAGLRRPPATGRAWRVTAASGAPSRVAAAGAPSRVAAVDWSGRSAGAERYIWLAVAERGRLVSLECGRDRRRLADHLVELALRDPALVVGLDFGFSLPLWFLDREGLENGMAVPEVLSERWLRECPPPFWGRLGRRRGSEPQHRRTELLVAPRAKPVFQIGGSGAVGTGSLRGFAVLARLRREGFRIWPFDDGGLPAAVEIFPRLLTGPVVKSRTAERDRYLRGRALPTLGAVSEDAFDAEVSALVMDGQRRQLGGLPPEADPVLRREGRIWTPLLSAAYSTSSERCRR
jgi:hypothetical protein